MKFNEFNLNPKILKAIEALNFEGTTEVQEKVMPLILEDKDVVVRSQTGSGKTFAYALPLIEKTTLDIIFPETLIVCPTRELASQVYEEFKKITGRMENIKTLPIFGGINMEGQIKALKRGPQIIIGTPGRLLDHIRRRTLKLQYIKRVVLDEADEMLNMGFKEDIEKILHSTPKTKQTLLFSATFPEKIKQIAEDFLINPVKVEIGQANKSLANINQSYAFVNRLKKSDALLEILETKKDKLILIFCNTKAMVDKLATTLVQNSYKAVCIHGDLKQSQRKKVLDSFKAGTARILIASDVAARGIDVKDIEYVINYDLPKDKEYFLHRIGRTARAGKSGTAITLITTKQQMQELKQIEAETKSSITPLTLIRNAYDMSIPQESSKEGQAGRRFSGRRPKTDYSNKNSFSRRKDSGKFEGFKKDTDEKRKPYQKSKREYKSNDNVESDFNKKRSYKEEFSSFDRKKSYSKDGSFYRKKPYGKDSFFDKKKPFDKEGSFDKRKSYDKDDAFDRKKFFDKESSFEKRKPYGKDSSFERKKPFGKERTFEKKKSYEPNKTFKKFKK